MRLRFLSQGNIVRIAVVMVIGAFYLFAANKFPNALHVTGFGPDWVCNSRGSICAKRSFVDPASIVKPPN
jgi:hypothetical protein